jgi:hypothetical protein
MIADLVSFNAFVVALVVVFHVLVVSLVVAALALPLLERRERRLIRGLPVLPVREPVAIDWRRAA